MKNINSIFTKDDIQYLKDNKHEITQELLDNMRAFGNSGKKVSLDILDLQKDDEAYYLDAFGKRITQNGNRMLKKPFTKLPLSAIHISEIEKCADDIHYFMDNYVQIVTPKGINFPDLREYQKGFIDIITPDANESIVGLLPRQCCSSTTTVNIINNTKEQELTFEELFNECKKEAL